MARRVRVNEGQQGVGLPNGRHYDGPVEVVLSDDEFEQVDPDCFPTILTDLGATNDSQVEVSSVVAPVTTVDSLAIKTAEGKVFMSGAKVALSASQVGALSIHNPASSDKVVHVIRILTDTDQTVDAEFVNDPTSTGAVRTSHNLNQAYDGVVPAAAQVRAGAAVLSGGTVMSPIMRSIGGIPRDIPVYTILPPGHSFAWRATAPSGLGATMAMYATVFWFEEPL